MPSARYHHGNLHDALLQTGLRIASAKGPAAVQVRELAQAEGVTPSAVYRHFPDLAHLSADIARLAREELARALIAAAAAVPEDLSPAVMATRRFKAIGRAYVEFAMREPNLFDTAFQIRLAQPSTLDDPSPWTVLKSAIDAMVAEGAMSADLRRQAPMVAWGGVHGIASVIVRRMLPPPYSPALALEATLDGIERSLGLRAEEPAR